MEQFDEDGIGFSWFGPWWSTGGVSMCGTFETRARGPLTAFFVLEVDVYLLYLILGERGNTWIPALLLCISDHCLRRLV